ncbi:hypothetical protein [Nonomuraea glycinis]|uniref:hypothetical protein n=1 Tax=Nonomuraea glycinis TaxID=2047744 RepID=UPI0033AD8077
MTAAEPGDQRTVGRERAGVPALSRAIAGGYQPDDQFELGLSAMLDGFANR